MATRAMPLAAASERGYPRLSTEPFRMFRIAYTSMPRSAADARISGGLGSV